MRLAYGAMAVALLAVIFGIIASNNTKPVPHVILVKNDGRSVGVRPIEADPGLRDVVVAMQLTNFVHSLFTRTGSYSADHYAITHDVGPLIQSTDASFTTINAYLGVKENDPRTSTTITSVDIDQPQKRSDDSWYIKFAVTTKKPSGEKISTQNYDVTAVLRFRNLTTEAEQNGNPTGLEIFAFPYQAFSGAGGISP